MNIFPETKFTDSELFEIAEHFGNAAVKKYLHSLSYNAGKDICLGAMKDGESAESYLRRVEYVKGGLGVIETLLAIEPAAKPE